jgi:hypothetical protein
MALRLCHARVRGATNTSSTHAETCARNTQTTHMYTHTHTRIGPRNPKAPGHAQVAVGARMTMLSNWYTPNSMIFTLSELDLKVSSCLRAGRGWRAQHGCGAGVGTRGETVSGGWVGGWGSRVGLHTQRGGVGPMATWQPLVAPADTAVAPIAPMPNGDRGSVRCVGGPDGVTGPREAGARARAGWEGWGLGGLGAGREVTWWAQDTTPPLPLHPHSLFGRTHGDSAQRSAACTFPLRDG